MKNLLKKKKKEELTIDALVDKVTEATDKQELAQYEAQAFVRDVLPMLKDRAKDTQEFVALTERVGNEFYSFAARLQQTAWEAEDHRISW